MKTRFLQPVLPFLALPLLTVSAYAQTTGVSNPDQTSDAAAVAAPSDHYVMPSHAADAATVAPQSYPATSYPATASAPQNSYPAATAADPAPQPALIVRQPLAEGSAAPAVCAPVQTASYQPESSSTLNRRPGPDDGVVQVRLIPHQLNEGFILKTRLDQAFSTETTVKGAPFSAQLLADAGHSGEVILPAGSVIHGRVTAVHGGMRIHGNASMRLQAESITLPDGTSYPLHATVSGLQTLEDQHVNTEGVIQPNTHPKETAIAIGSVTGAATILGAAVGGGVGAGVGALVGASAGAIFWLKQDSQETLASGTGILFSLDAPLQLNGR